MAVLGLSRRELAERCDFEKRALDSWLLPSESKGYRRAPPEVLEKLQKLELEATLAKRGFYEGSLSKIVPVVATRSPTIIFPTVYRHSIRSDVSDGEEVRLTFDPAPMGRARRRSSDVVRPLGPFLSGDDPMLDEGGAWLMIQEHKNLDALNGYFNAIYRSFDFEVRSTISGCFFMGSLFTLHLMPTPPGARYDVLTQYSSDTHWVESKEDGGVYESVAVIRLDGRGERVTHAWESDGGTPRRGALGSIVRDGCEILYGDADISDSVGLGLSFLSAMESPQKTKAKKKG